MRKVAAAIVALLILLSSCGKAEYHPMIVMPNGFSAKDGVISGKLVNVYFFSPYESIFPADGGKMTLYSDETLSAYLEDDGGVIELLDGENDFVLVFEKDGLFAKYDLHITCVMILDFSVEIITDKTYSVGDEFDKSTVAVTATKENGDTVAVTDYSLDYDFSAAGERRVNVYYGGIVHSVFVNVG